MKSNKLNFKTITDRILKNKLVRTAITRKSHLWFFYIYLTHYATYEIAPFQREMFAITENADIKNAIIVAFRGSAKSTIFSLSYPLWAIMGVQQLKFILIISQTQTKSQQILLNLKHELESNELLRRDLGPFQIEGSQWNMTAICLPKYGAKIMAASMEQGIRGLRHHNYRPQLIICDDLEDLDSTKIKENRDKLYQWFIGDILPAGDINTRTILIGNLLHEDSLIMRLKKEIEDKTRDGFFCFYPIIDNNEEITWKGKFPNMDAIETEKRKIGNEITWQRENMLRIVPNENRIVRREWIKYYDILPNTDQNHEFKYSATGIDLAISEKDNANFTAMVSGHIFGSKENLQIYIVPSPVNERLTSLQARDKAELISRTLGNGTPTPVFVEDVAYQRAFIEMLKERGIPAEEFKVRGQDKTARLTIAALLIQSGKVLFPMHGAEKLIEQLINFNSQKYDDLADAFAILILKVTERTTQPNGFYEFAVEELKRHKNMSEDEIMLERIKRCFGML